MIVITPNQEKVLELFIQHPGSKVSFIAQLTDYKHVSSMAQTLHKKGLLRRDGTERLYEYSPTFIKYFVTPNGKKIFTSFDIEEDPFLKRLSEFKFTPTQEEYVRKASHLTKNEIAKKLGISKLELNFGIERMGGFGDEVD